MLSNSDENLSLVGLYRGHSNMGFILIEKYEFLMWLGYL
jgi:hypothetical protein